MAEPSGSAPDGADGRAFDLPGGPDAALLLHGLTGSPFEVRYLADRLHEPGGYRCLGPLLPGHGSAEELARTRWRDWVEGARAELLRLSGARRTVVVGCSMGALLACVLARDLAGRVDGLVLLAPALELTRPGRLAGWLARHTLIAKVWPFARKRTGSDVGDEEMRARNPCLDAVPLASVAELLELARHVDALLPEIRVPALVVAGARDHTVTVAGARRMAGRLGGGARLVVLPRSQHLVGIDVERERCAEEVRAFLRAAAPGTEARTLAR
ncbi:MAG TPA: alpha/beta fold hydrolase [Anaeromyxobacteraceae bacterium]|nr:alpha/beta fold hydrolase [Anaeromyxobacteraceae bacterium]